jgi:ComF family protein
MLDFIFPKVCPFCESVSKDGKICIMCLEGIRFIKGRAICLKCGVPFGFIDSSRPATQTIGFSELPDYDSYTFAGAVTALADSTPGHFCGKCLLGEFYFERARSVAFYDGLLKDMLHKFKYERKLALGGVLSTVLTEYFPDDLDASDIIVPAPLYIDRLRKREYNQSVILGENLARFLRVSFNPFVIKRIRDTKPQFEIKSEDEKRKNVRGAFSVENSQKIKGKSVLFIDDVFTTGSTINECTRVLLDSGASHVQVITLMRAVQI